ncbi:hypothetical protein AB0L53_53235 [Nonomuraea sp. NPDC052129]|uniref:hypothetical protein n=1 Tax=Nonomuraea sp. NPDC052129 TaxID=3154651 RepID=UPI003445F62C
MSYRIRRLADVACAAAATSLLLGAPAMAASEKTVAGAVHAQTVLGPYASFEVCAVSGLQGQQAHQWISWFCSQNGTTQWWLFTTP